MHSMTRSEVEEGAREVSSRPVHKARLYHVIKLIEAMQKLPMAIGIPRSMNATSIEVFFQVTLKGCSVGGS